ncbi:hypothetical protein scyTo_0005083 [Scyliorhinus torazame]|uniref:Uncharacterized protein n=1 Tax=Scyliorhinus torazame TaxID=75743 RepID=A0A401P1Z1_SCYTO|nr:hypothetical protein [Scyliorhinus torazame]
MRLRGEAIESPFRSCVVSEFAGIVKKILFEKPPCPRNERSLTDKGGDASFMPHEQLSCDQIQQSMIPTQGSKH